MHGVLRRMRWGLGRDAALARRSSACLAGLLIAAVLIAATATAANAPTRVNDETTIGHRTVVAGASRLIDGGRQIYALNFGSAGPYTGSALITATRGTRLVTTPTTDGQVSAAISDGTGGWYVGGDFDTAGGTDRHYLAELNARGQAVTTFRPRLNGFVDAIVRSGSRLYVGGFFSRADGRPEVGVAELDARTGRAISSFHPLVGGNVTELTIGDGTIYLAATAAAGSASSVNQLEANRLLALDPASGARRTGFAAVVPRLTALSFTHGTLYAGTSDSADGVLALNPGSGARVAGFRPPHGRVEFLATDGDRLLVGGELHRLVGAIAIDPRTGRRDPDFACAFGGTVNAISGDGNRLVLGGSPPSQDKVQGAPTASGIVQTVDAKTCTPAGPALHPAGPVNAVALDRGRLLTGGFFATGVPRSGQIATFDTRTGALVHVARSVAVAHETAVNLNRRGAYPADAYAPSAATYGGGLLWLWYPGLLLGVDPRTGRAVVTRFHTGPFSVSSLTVAAGRLFAVTGGYGAGAGRVLTFDLRTGRPSHGFRVPLRGETSAIAPGDGALYLAGSYKRTRPDGQKANIAVLRVDPETGRLDSAFDPHVNGPVQALIVRPAAIYLDGFFYFAGNARRHGLAAVDPRTGRVLHSFAPIPPGVSNLRTNGSSLALVGDRLLYEDEAAYDVAPDCYSYEDDPTNEFEPVTFDARTGRRMPNALNQATLLYGAVAEGDRIFANRCVNVFSTVSGPKTVNTVGLVPVGH